ncbi:MAG: ATP-binding protein [Bacteroidales bacterium]|nr:ATP-binding protein [Bacteroidales bacterium]
MSDKVSIKEIANAFTPAKEISDAEKFAGRKEFVNDAFYGLVTEGANLAIVGGRGIGKSSLARQIINISQGDNSLLDRLNIHNDEKLDFLSIYLACGDNIKTVSDLLTRLLTTRDCLLEWIYDIPNASKELGKISGGLDVKIAKIGSEIADETTSSKAIQTHEIDVVFQNVISEILKAKIAKNGILIVIDEFDQIEDPSGFAKLIKSLATNIPGLKFCIVGVAQDIQNLMKEHESTDRLFAGSVINLPSMQPSELNEIIDTAENSIRDFIKFDTTARDKLIELANGHPYIVHLIGKQALRSAYLEPTYELNEEYILRILSEIAEREADPVLEGRYKRAVASSYQREAVLKSLFAVIQKDGEIRTSDAYKVAIDYDVDNPSQYVGHLVTEDYGAEIIKVRERYYRFKDSLFATYVNARPWLTKNK